MRVNIKSDTAIAPLPVLVIGSYDKDGKANVMTAAWGGVFNDNQIIVTLAKDHYTTTNILANRDFSLFYADRKHVAEVDYFGLASGAKEDKLNKVGFHSYKGEFANAPMIEELPLGVECRVNNVLTPDDGTVVIIADVLNISVQEDMLVDGKPSLDKLELISYDTFNHTYRIVGDVVEKAYIIGKKYLK